MLLSRIGALVLIALAMAAAANAVSPNGIAWTASSGPTPDRVSEDDGAVVSAQWVQTILDDPEWLVLDARSAKVYEQGHLPGAISLPIKEIDRVFASVSILMSADQPMVVYCASQTCDDARDLAAFLRDRGYENIKLFDGGYAQWTRVGLPIEKGL